MEKRATTPRRKSRQTQAKVLITTLSLAATLGAWQVFARQGTSLAPGEPAGPAPERSRAEASPLPTLVPPLGDASAPALVQGPADPQFAGPLFLGGSKPQVQQPSPAARTRSSR